MPRKNGIYILSYMAINKSGFGEVLQWLFFGIFWSRMQASSVEMFIQI